MSAVAPIVGPTLGTLEALDLTPLNVPGNGFRPPRRDAQHPSGPPRGTPWEVAGRVP